MKALLKSMLIVITLVLVTNLASQEHKQPPIPPDTNPKHLKPPPPPLPPINRDIIKKNVWGAQKDGIHVRFSRISDKFKVEDMIFPRLEAFLSYSYQLPTSILNDLTTEQLFLFCAEQPSMLYSFNLSDDKYFIPLQSFNGYEELIKRPGYLDDLSMLAENYAKDDAKANEFCYLMSFFYKESVYKQLTNAQKIYIYNALLYRVKLGFIDSSYYFMVPRYVSMFLTSYGKQNDVDIPNSLGYIRNIELLSSVPKKVELSIDESYSLMDEYVTQMITNLSK